MKRDQRTGKQEKAQPIIVFSKLCDSKSREMAFTKKDDSLTSSCRWRALFVCLYSHSILNIH